MLNSILTTTSTGAVSLGSALLCTAAALVLGIVSACFYMFRNNASKTLVIALAMLPAMVQVVILMVNGNLGAGVAVAGAFSLVRFRSVPGSAREITSIFFAMAIGLACGMGCVAFAAVFTLVLGFVQMLLQATPFGESRKAAKEVRITVPENLDYVGLFDDVMQRYTADASLKKVRTASMGATFELLYNVTLKDASQEKQFIDALRCRNGNLPITCGRCAIVHDEL